MIFILLQLSMASLVFESYDQSIDPGRVLWPESSWVNNPIDFSLNHAGENVSVYISFSSSSQIQNGVVEIHFPSGFDLTNSPYYIDDNTLIIPTSISDTKQTIQLTIPNIILPTSPGSYGPFSIYTRHSANGQIVDMNKIFCSVSILKTNLPPPSDSLTISFVDVNMDTVKAKSELLFTFELSEDLWKFDSFVITIPEVFQLLNPVCRSENVEDNSNYLKTDANDFYEFGCMKESNKLYIYGLSADIDISVISDTGNLVASFSVSGFTNPEADFNIETYEWSLDIYRFSSNSIVQSFNGQGPETYPGVVSVNSWQPHNSFDSKKILSGLVLFMDLSFTPDHQIPASGSFQIKFNGVDLTSKAWKSDEDQSLTSGSTSYYYIEPYIGGTCVIETSQLACSGFDNNINARNTITVSLLVEFLSTSANIQKITTYLNDEIIIDNSEDYPYGISYANTVELLSEYSLLFSSNLDTSSALRVCNTGGGLYYIVVYFQTPVDLTTDSKIYIYLPVSTNNPGDFSINLDNTLTGVYVTGSSLNTDISTGSSLDGVSVNTLGFSFSLTATASEYVSVALFKDDGTGSPAQMNLPYIGSNEWTRYESRIEFVVSVVAYTSSAPFTILPDSPSITFELLCTDSNRAGLPARITGNMNFDYSTLYYLYIDIEFSAGFASDLGSGLDDGEEYPFDIDITSAIPKSSIMTLKHGSGPTLTLSGLSSVLQTSVLRAFFPIGSLSAGTYSVTVSLYSLKKDRSDIHFEVFSKTISRTVSSNTKDWQSASSSITSSQIDSYLDSSSENGYDITLQSASSASNSIGYIGVILPKGFSVSNPSVTDGTYTLSNPLSFSSRNNQFAFPGILAQETTSLSLSTSTSTTLHFLGIKTVNYYTSSSPSVTLRPYEGLNTWNSACESISGTVPTLTLSRGKLSPSITPTKVVGRGPQSLQQSMSIKFTTVSNIPSQSYIELAIDSEWEVTVNTYLTIKGIDKYSVSTSTTPYKISELSQTDPDTDIEIIIYNLMPPVNSGSTEVSTGCIDYVSIYASNNALIDSWIDNSDSIISDSCVKVSTQNDMGSPIYKEVSAFPDLASTDAVSLFIQFSLENPLPTSSSITVKSPTSSWAQSGDIKDKCWFSIKYSACTVSGSSLIIVTDEEYVDSELSLLIDDIIDTPISIDEELSISISTTFSGVSIDQDTDTVSNQTLILVNPPTEIFTSTDSGVKIEPSNIGEQATYNFSFSISTKIVKNDEIWIKFPDDYDPYLGQSDAKFSMGEPNNFYIDCQSEVLGNINCKVDHWYIIISNLNTVLPDTKIILTLFKVSNPSTTSQLYFKFYLLDSDKSIKAFKSDFSSILLTGSAESNIKIRSIETSNKYLSEISDYNFTFYLQSITFSQYDSLLIKFPVQYTLDWDLQTDSVFCESFVVDESENSVLLSSKQWNSESNCTYLGSNVFSMNISQIGSWTSSDRISIVLKGVKNPEWGFSRDEYYDGQSNDYFPGYTDWTNEFELGALESSSGYLMGKSYANINPGFIGFSQSGSKLTIGGYNPMYKSSHILIVPGTQSLDLSIKISEDWGLKAKKIVFKPKNHIKNSVTLNFASAVHDFFILQGEQSINFKVSLEIGAQNGLYYIEWDLNEYSLIGLTQPAYSKPCKTLVEVYSGFTYQLSSIPALDIIQGTESIPILISSPVPPASNFTLALSFEDASLNGIEISPISLTFSSETTQMFFKISVSSSFNGKLNTLYSIKFGLTGPDFSVFQVPEFQFRVLASQKTYSASVTLSVSNIQMNSVDLYIKTNLTTTVYWQLLPYGTELLTYSELFSLIRPLVSDSTSSGVRLSDQIKLYHASQEIEPDLNETWSDYQKRSYTSSLTHIWYDVAYIQSNTLTLIASPNWLWAETEYLFVGYDMNNPDSLYSTSFVTSDLPESVSLELLFSDIVVESKAYPLTTIVAYNLAVPEKQLESLQVVGRRVLTDTTLFTWVFYPNRAWNISPLELFFKVDQEKLALDVENSGIGNLVISFLGKSIDRDSYQSPYWTNSGFPSLVNVSDTSVNISLKSAVSGIMCCIAEEFQSNSSNNSFVNPVSPTQIFLLLNSYNLNASGACVSNSATNFINVYLTISNLSALTNYTATCSAYNTYPLWPVSSPYSDTLSLPSIDFLTLNSSVDESESSYSVQKIALVSLLYLISS